MPCSFTRILDWPALVIAWLSRILIPALAGRIRTVRPAPPGTVSRKAPGQRVAHACPARHASASGPGIHAGRTAVESRTHSHRSRPNRPFLAVTSP